MTRLHAFGLGALVAVVAVLAAEALRPAPVVPDVSAAEREARIARENELAALVLLDSATARLQEDSARWEAERDSLAAKAAEDRRRSYVIASDLTARLDSTSNALFVEYAEARDSIDAANAERIATLEAERAALYATLSTAQDYTGSLEASLAAERGLSDRYEAAWRAEEALRRRAERSNTWTRSLGAIVVAGLLIERLTL